MLHRPTPTRVLFALLLALGFVAPVGADITLPAVISDGMVLQCESEVVLWGWAASGERVRVTASWAENAIEATADARRRWMVRLQTPEAGGPHSITVAGHNTIVLTDVLVGEVWLCSGQSNMEMSVGDTRPGYRGVANAEAEVAAADHPRIRLFTVRNTLSAPRRIDCRGSWTACTPETVYGFSATGYFFGRELHRELDVPVGLISADWGGTVAEAWMSAEALAGFPEIAPALQHLRDLQDPVKRQGVVEARVRQWWIDLDRGGAIATEWIEPGFDDSSWKTMTLPASLGGDGLDVFDGVVHFRTAVELPADWRGGAGALRLGPIDDYDDAWVNGVHVGSTHAPGQWAHSRRYAIPEGVLRTGRNVIAVRLLDTGGTGGINGAPEQMSLATSASSAASGGDVEVSLARAWRYTRGRAMGDLPVQPEGADISPNAPSVLFNGMIAPLVPYGIRGAIWYQGESNRSTAARYRTLFPALIEGWRSEWGRGAFPFYYVQIAPYQYGGDTGQAALLREAQAAALTTPNTGMAVTLDIGNPTDIHPANKQEVGRRLARWALARTYGRRDLVFSGPAYRGMEVDGKTIRIHFDHVGTGLELRRGAKSAFRIAGADRQFVEATATIDGDDLVVSSPRVARPVAARYAWEASPEVALFNREGLPAGPFRTDHW